jgi:hypothetical protein
MNYMYRREGILGGVDRRLDSDFSFGIEALYTHTISTYFIEYFHRVNKQK